MIHSGRQLATAEARLVGPDGTLYAHATTTCLVLTCLHNRRYEILPRCCVGNLQRSIDFYTKVLGMQLPPGIQVFAGVLGFEGAARARQN